MNTAGITASENRTKVQTWLMEEGWSLREENPSGLSWGFVATDRNNRRLAVGQPIDRPDQIVIQAMLILSPQDKQRFIGLPEKERKDLTMKIVSGLLRTEVQFDANDPTEMIGIAQRIYEDGLTKDAFFQRYDKVLNGIILVMLEMSHKFSTPPPEAIPIGFGTAK